MFTAWSKQCRWLYGLACGLSLSGMTHAGTGKAIVDEPTVSAIVGDWLVASRDAVIHADDELEGRIVWQLHDTYGPEDGPALSGKIVKDRKNPDPTKRSLPITDLKMLWGLHYDADDKLWKNGRVYDADNGRTYDCQIRLISPDRLKLRGCIGFSLPGGSTLWSRVTMTIPMHDGLPYVMHTTGG
jgi:uncharacterized protein (DUF2147 family)